MRTTEPTKLASLGRLTLAPLLVLIVLSGLATAAPALAAGEPHPPLFEFGTGSGSFEKPNGIAVDESTGDVYVAAIGTQAVYKFDASGTPVSFMCGVECASYVKGNELTGSSTVPFAFPTGARGTPAAIAVDNSTNPADPSAGDLYVMDAGHGVIDKFNPEGKYISEIAGYPPATGSTERELLGLAVDAGGVVRVELSIFSENTPYVAVDEFDDSLVNHLVATQRNPGGPGSAGMPKQLPEAEGFAVGPTGDDFLLYGGSCSCAAAVGQQLAGLGSLDNAGSGDVALAADPATGHVYVESQSSLDSVTEWDTGAMNGGSTLLPGATNYFAGVGVPVSSFGSQLSGSSGQGGVAVNGASGDIYVADPGAGNAGEGKVYVFGSDAPAVTVGAAAGVSKEAAMLSGTVNPRGAAVASCEFEYGVANEFGQVQGGSYEHSVACAPGASGVGVGESPVAVSAGIPGPGEPPLQAGLLYRFRLKTENASGTGESSGLFGTLGEGFGVKTFESSFLNEDGSPDTQAGSHPYEYVNNFEFNSHFERTEANADSRWVQEPNGTLRDLYVDLPPGVAGDPNATATKCTLNQLDELNNGFGGAAGCPPAAALGHLILNWSPSIADGRYGTDEPVFSMVPPRGVALQLGINYIATRLFINSGLLAGGDYPIRSTLKDIPPAAPVLRSRLTLWGEAGREAVLEAEKEVSEGAGVGAQHRLEEARARLKPFFTLPTGCRGPLRSTIEVDSYQEPGRMAKKEYLSKNGSGALVGLTGCSTLRFPPSITVKPDTSDASTSSGLTVGVDVPQAAAQNPAGLAESALRDTTVTLPEGVALNPSGGDGLEACSEGLAGFEFGRGVDGSGFEEFNPGSEPGVTTATFNPAAIESLQPGVSFCPDGSKIGTVKIKTPLLEHELEGSVYLATQNSNPFGSLVAMYLMVEDPISGSTVKLTGEVRLCEAAGQLIGGVACQGEGQIVTTFKDTPDLPFEELQLHFFGGERAPLATPSRCGTYTTQAVFTPWDGNGPENRSSSFQIDHGPGGGPCPGASLPFAPALAAGDLSKQAGAFSPLTTTISRADGNQNMQSVQLHMPPGLSGILTGVKLCPEAQANAGTCGAESLIGETTVSAGVGSDPVSVKGGRVYLTEKYAGAPFGLSIVNPVKAGPFDLEHDTSNPNQQPACDCIVVRARIEVDPLTAALTVTTDPSGPHAIPHFIDGIPVQIQKVNVTIDRERFTFNPTNCTPASITGAITGDEGGSSPVSVPFQASKCELLKFTPKFAVSTSGRTSKARGASLTARVAEPAGALGTQANIARVKVELPRQLPSRLTTLQKACTAAQFEANPAGCPSPSVIGHATVLTPLVPVPLEGPVYFVSHGGEAFPSLEVVLQGYGVKVILVGTTFISKSGVTSTTFKTVPDAPFSSFELTLGEGPYSALAANGNLCALTKTVTVKKKVTIKTNGHRRTVTRNVKEKQPASLRMPTEFVAQNGAEIHQTTPISVTGCGKSKPAKKAKKKARGKK
jgi:hypothetical protein